MMNNEPKVNSVSIQEFFENAVSRQTIEDDAKATQQQEEDWKQMITYTPEQMSQHLTHELMSTEILVEGISYATQMSEGSSILFAGLIRARETTEAALAWIEARIEENLEDDEKTTRKSKKTTTVAEPIKNIKRATPKKAVTDEDDL